MISQILNTILLKFLTSAILHTKTEKNCFQANQSNPKKESPKLFFPPKSLSNGEIRNSIQLGEPNRQHQRCCLGWYAIWKPQPASLRNQIKPRRKSIIVIVQITQSWSFLSSRWATKTDKYKFKACWQWLAVVMTLNFILSRIWEI